MRIIAALLLTLISVSGVWAQTAEPPPGMNASVVVTLITSENGTNDNLQLELSGTFPGDPLVLVLDQPGDLQPTQVNIYNFIVPHTYCEMFQFKLSLLGSDDWLGQQVSVQIDGAQVYYDGAFFQGGMLGVGSWRSGTWDGTAAYRDHCATIPMDVTTVTGSDGTVDNPVFYLEGDFSASPYAFSMNQPSDLQPGQGDTYQFDVPMGFCQMTGWKLVKGASGGIDDAWLPNQISIDVDSTEVYFDGVFNEVGPITSASNIGGTWNGTAAYQNRCLLVFDPGVITLLPTATLALPGGFVPVNPALIQPVSTLVRINPNLIQPLMTPTLVRINPNLIQPLATATLSLPGGIIPVNPTLIQPVTTLVQINPNLIQPLATATPNSGVTQCINAPPPRLKVGGTGRVTPGAPNRIRSQPNTSGAILGQIPPSDLFSVIGGPTCDGVYTWWQINYNGIVGWTAEGTGSDYFVEPV